MKVLFALSTDKVSDLIVQRYQQKYGELLDFKKVYFFDAILRELEKDTNYDSIIIDESLEGKFKDGDLVKRIGTISTAAVKGDNTKIPLILILTPERVAGVPILYSLYNMGINNALLGTDRKFSKICELIVRPRNAKEAKEYYVIDAKDPDFEEQVVELVPEAQIINIKKFYKGLEKEKYSETFDKIASQYSDVELLYIIDKLPEEIKETLKSSNNKFNEIIKNSNSIQTKIKEAEKEKLNTSVNRQNNENDPFSNERLLRKQEYIQKINMNNNPQKFNQNVDNNSAKKAKNTINNVLNEEKENQKQNQKQNQVKEQVQKQPQEQEEKVVEENQEELEGLKEENKNQIEILTQNEKTNIINNEKSELEKANENNEITKQEKEEQPEEISEEELNDVDQEIENLKKELEQISLEEQSEEKELEKLEESKQEKSNNNNNNNNNSFNNPQTNNNQTLNSDVKEEKEKLNKEEFKKEETILNTQDNKSDDEIEIEFEEEDKELKKVQLGNEEQVKLEEKHEQEKVMPNVQDNNVDDEIEVEFEEEKEQETKLEDNNNNNSDSNNNKDKQIQKPIRIDSINKNRVTEDINDIGLEESDLKDVKSGIEKSKEEETNEKLKTSNNIVLPEKGTPKEQQKEQNQKQENKIDIEEIKNIGEIIPEEVNKKIKTNVENNNANINIDQNKPTNNAVENNKDNQINNNNSNANKQQNQNITTLNNQNNQNSQRHNMQNVPNNIKNMNNSYNKVPNPGMHNNQNIGVNPNMKNIHNMNNMNSMRNIQARNGYAPKEKFDPKILEKYVNNKSAIFVGTSKSGVTFMINSLAMIFASIGINTAILDMTRNKNDYYMTTDNNEELRNIAAESINKLKHGIAEGIQLNRNLTMYTGTPFDNSYYGEAGKVLTTLYNNHTVVLIDADYSTPKEYFEYVNNIFAIQTLDILTMQPLTHFMKELKKANILNDEKIKIIINKELPVKGLNKKLIIGGLSTYNSPTMSSMEQLFNRNTVNVFSVPFDIGVYQRYLTNIVECKLDITGYPKPFIEQLKLIANNIYPLENKGKEKIVIQNEFRPQGGPNVQNGMNNMGNMRRY